MALGQPLETASQANRFDVFAILILKTKLNHENHHTTPMFRKPVLAAARFNSRDRGINTDLK